MIRQRGSAYQVEVRIGKDPATGKWVRRAGTFDSLTEARKAERKLLAEAETLRAAHVHPSRQPLSQYLGEWQQTKAREGLSPKTLYDYSDLSERYIIPAVGKIALIDLTPKDVRQLIERVATRHSRTAQYVRSVLRSALTDAVRDGLVPVNVADRNHQRPVRRQPRRVAAFTVEEVAALAAAARDTRVGPLVRFAFVTGLRMGELLGLKWSDIDLDHGTVAVVRSRTLVGGRPTVKQPKTPGSVRLVPLVQQARDALDAQREMQDREHAAAGPAWEAEGWVFAATTGGGLDPNNVGRAFRSLLKRAGVPSRPFHALRHSAASVLLAAGVPPAVAAKVLGHANISTFLDLYAELLPQARAETARRVETFLEDALAPKTDPAPQVGGAQRPRDEGLER